MYTSGFTFIYRDEELDSLFLNPKKFHWWIWLRLHAAPKPTIQYVGESGIRVRVQYGEIAATYSFLQRAWHADPRSVSDFLSDLEEEGRITIREEKGIKIIKINNFERFSPPAGYFSKRNRNESRSDMVEESNTQMQGDMHDTMLSESPDEMNSEMLSETPTELPTSRKIDKEEKLKNNFSDSSAREKGFFEELKISDLTIEQMLYSLKPLDGKDGLMRLLDEFFNYCLSTEDFHPDYKSFKQHFINWARIQIRENSKVKTKTAQNGNKEKGAGAASAGRRGSEGSARTAADYEKSFSPPTES